MPTAGAYLQALSQASGARLFLPQHSSAAVTPVPQRGSVRALGWAKFLLLITHSDHPHHRGLLEIGQYIPGTLTVLDLLASNQGPVQASQLPREIESWRKALLLP